MGKPTVDVVGHAVGEDSPPAGDADSLTPTRAPPPNSSNLPDPTSRQTVRLPVGTTVRLQAESLSGFRRFDCPNSVGACIRKLPTLAWPPRSALVFSSRMNRSKHREQLQQRITRTLLRKEAGARSFTRGEEYRDEGRVGVIAERERTISAEVRGEHRYTARIWIEGQSVGFSCTCPLGRDGVFCKHAVALGLAWCEPRDESAGSAAATEDELLEPDGVRQWLLEQDRSALVELVMEHAGCDESFARQLLLAAAKGGEHGANLATLRQVIDSAVTVDGFVPYEEVWAYTQGIDRVVDTLAEMAASAQASEAIDLIEYALAKVEDTIESVDDDGDMGPILDRLQEIHLAACRAAAPDRKALARRLFARELDSPWGVFSGAVESYADVLGEDGLAEYRRLAEDEWRRVPPRAPDDVEDERGWRHAGLARIMEDLARWSGDIEALVAVKARNLSSESAYLQIAEIYQEAGDGVQALAWAEKGVAAFPKRTDPRLREFLTGMYHALGRHDDAVALAWIAFVEGSHLDAYKNLRRHARLAKSWPQWRERALQTIREGIAAGKRAAAERQFKWQPEPDNSSLVQIFLDEGDPEAAWREACAGGCWAWLWLELADRRADEHPDDALGVWKKQMEPTIAGKNNDAYRQAVALLRKIHGALAPLGREPEFTAYLAALRLTHKRLRNLMKMLDHAAWT
ncbi:MAG: hypothetical protein EPN53_09970 [Acidobacteria bacterium]|nr:MAG: hypothetical protein EPN53_09970 [Acidobacteriota bacterium]